MNGTIEKRGDDRRSYSFDDAIGSSTAVLLYYMMMSRSKKVSLNRTLNP
jgi:hypothetical protein